jgi:hypothetical protein
MRDIAARNWQDPTQRKFRTLLTDRLHSYATHKGYRYVEQLTLDATTEFRATWKDAPLTAQKNLERLRMFFRFCIDREWTANNPAAKLKVKVQVKEKDPFSLRRMVAHQRCCVALSGRPRPFWAAKLPGAAGVYPGASSQRLADQRRGEA